LQARESSAPAPPGNSPRSGRHRQRRQAVLREKAGKELTRLLREHILIAADIVKAAKPGDTKAVAAGQLMFADALTDGIVKQFSSKFASN